VLTVVACGAVIVVAWTTVVTSVVGAGTTVVTVSTVATEETTVAAGEEIVDGAGPDEIAWWSLEVFEGVCELVKVAGCD
jgi:hypothetical protein